jgi:Putative ABC exporter
MLRYSTHWIACLIGIWLTIQFMQLFAMAVVMLGQTIGERAFTTLRRGALFAALALVLIIVGPKLAAGLNHNPTDVMRQIHATLPGRILLFPFDVLTAVITAQNIFPTLLESAALALAIDLLMLAVVIGLDANYMETAATLSLRRYERFNRLRRGGVAGMTGRATTRFSVKPLPYFGGAGPIVWRQLTSAVRNSRGLFILLSIFSTVGVVFVINHHSQQNPNFGSIAGVAIWINLIFVSMLKFDFRDELDRLDLLRSLPIRPAAIAVAEVAVPTLLLCAIQFLLLIAAASLHLAPAPILLAAAAFTLPFNLFLVSIENLMFLLFPLRSVGLIAGDMQMVGRQMIIFFCKFLLLMTGLALSAILALPAYIVGQKSWPAFIAAMWFALSVISAAMIPILAQRFSRFDPSVDTPA